MCYTNEQSIERSIYSLVDVRVSIYYLGCIQMLQYENFSFSKNENESLIKSSSWNNARSLNPARFISPRLAVVMLLALGNHACLKWLSFHFTGPPV